MGFDITSVYISPQVRGKIGSKHGLSADDVLDACADVVSAAEVYDDERGWRLFIEGRNARGRAVLVVLYPAGAPGFWNLGTAYFG